MNLIKDWIYAIKVCRKYGITWNPFHNTDYARHRFAYWCNEKKYKSMIFINPFYDGFLDSFLHEVGHHVYNKNAYMKSKNIKDYEEATSDTLGEEYLCWRFAKLVRKRAFNKDRARYMFKSYFPSTAKKVGSLQAADVYYKFDRSIAK